MHVYELALQMGVRSTDLVERARQLGMTGVGPASSLSAQQVEALRAGLPAASPGSTQFTPAAPSNLPPPRSIPHAGAGGRPPSRWLGIAAVVVLVAGFVGAVALVGARSEARREQRREAVAARNDRLEEALAEHRDADARRAADRQESSSQAGETKESASVTVDPDDARRERFCDASDEVLEVSARFVPSFSAGDVEGMVGVATANRDEWVLHLTVMAETAPEGRTEVIGAYRASLESFLYSLGPNTTMADVQRWASPENRAENQSTSRALSNLIRGQCG